MSIEDEIDAIKEDFCSKGPDFDVEFEAGIHCNKYGLANLFIPREHRGKGHGSRLMGQFVSILDKHGYGASLMASEKYEDSTLEELIEFYEKFSFIPVGLWGNDDKGFRQWLMVRDPAKPD